jgi:hypothetical protein
MWDEYGLGLQPQSPQFTMSYWLWVAQTRNSNSLVGISGRNMVGTHPHAHPQHIKVVKHLLYILLMWDEYGLGLQHQSPHFTMSYWLWVAQTRNSNSLVGMSGRNMVGTHPHAHPQHKRLSKTFHIYNIDVRWIWVGSTASIKHILYI